MNVVEQGNTLVIDDESFSFRRKFNYSIIKSFLTGPKSIVLGLGDRLDFAQSFPDDFELSCYDLKKPSTQIPSNVIYQERDVRGLEYESLSKDYDNLITHLLCEKGDALIIKDLLPKFKCFDSIILGLCDKPAHYNTNCEDEYINCEVMWDETLKMKKELSDDYHVNLFFTRHKREEELFLDQFTKKFSDGTLYEIVPYLLIATKHKPVIKDKPELSYSSNFHSERPIFQSNAEYARYMQQLEHRNT